jgi:hypothetical protein
MSRGLLPLGVTESRVTLQVANWGAPEQESATWWLNPFTETGLAPK